MVPPANIVFIEGLIVYTKIGVAEWEQYTVQPVQIDAKYSPPVPFADVADTLTKAIDYTQVAADLTTWLQERQFQLLETAAHVLAERLVTHYKLTWLQLTLRKPRALLGALATGVTVTKSV